MLFQHKFDKAEAVMDGLLAHGDTNSPKYTALLALKADAMARCGRWDKAEAAAAKVLIARPDDFGSYHRLAPLMAVNHDIAGYQKLCRQIVSRFTKVDFPIAADQMAKDCLILPSSGIDPKAVAPLADLAVTQGQAAAAYPYFQCCKALSEYRQQHFQEAAKWAQDASMNSYPYSQAEALAILSMAQAKLKMKDAQATLSRCQNVIRSRLHQAGVIDLEEDWRDWIIVHVLFDEATDLIQRNQ
jgi:hypothetical protein